MERVAVWVAIVLILGGVVYAGGVYWWEQNNRKAPVVHEYSIIESARGRSLVFFKQPECGCCDDWLRHASMSGFNMSELPLATFGEVAQQKRLLGVPESLAACHTSFTPDKRYVFEGHVPASAIADFLDEPVEGAIGLIVPGMPIGSPGMEVADRFMSYDVLLFMQDGSQSVYRSYQCYDQQFE